MSIFLLTRFILCSKKKKDLIVEYFTLIEERSGAIQSLNAQIISQSEYFPIYGFASVCNNINDVEDLKCKQKERINSLFTQNRHTSTVATSIDEILRDNNICKTHKLNEILYAVKDKRISLENLKEYLQGLAKEDRNSTENRKLLCLYDIMKYGDYSLE